MQVNRHSLIFGLSYALDIAGKNNLSHSKSTAYLSVQIAKALEFNKYDTLALYYAALLHDIGISTEYVLYEHCKIGAEMLKKLPLPEEIPVFVLYHHEHYDGSGPLGLSGEEIPQPAQIICLCSSFDDDFGKQPGAFDRSLFLQTQSWLEAKRSLFSEVVLDTFIALTKREAFLLDYFNQETKYKLSDEDAMDDEVCYDYDEVLRFALCFADVIDRRSQFTYTHSQGIARLAKKAAAHLGYDAEIQDKMFMAGLLHDIGKLDVPIDILHKNGKLTPEERFEINKHTYYSRKIMEQIPGLEDIVKYAVNHHEKIDGTGYPYRIPGEKLGELERAMAICDVYQALTEERPYRAPLPEEKVWSIIGDMAEKGHLDGVLAGKLKGQFE